MAAKSVSLLLLLLCHTFVYAQIKHVIVLMEENRSFDHFFGWFPGADGLTGNEYNLVNQSNPNSQRVYVSKANNDVAQCDPDHSISGTTAKIFGVPATEANNLTDPNMSGFVEWEIMKGNTGTDYCAVMASFTPEDLPIMSTLASEFVLMDRFFCAVPGPTWPNRLFMLSATSMGLTETGEWYQNQEGQLFPQPTIFDQVAGAGLSWKHYFNDTPWELFLSSVVHHPENVQSMEQFYLDAASGNLPNFAWMNPRAGVNMSTGLGSNDDHPDHDVALGEQYYKDIYEALRASPQWNETLFIITFDEHGGFYDHVPPPMNVPPPGDDTPTYPDKGVMFDRLGVRIPTLLISPWVPKGLILSEPPEAQKPEPNSEYTLTSIMATVRKVLGINSGPLNKRDAWSATFEQVLSEAQPRTDCPEHLPDAPPPHQVHSAAEEAKLPLNGLQKDIMKFHANMMGEEMPDHVVVQGQFSDWAQNKFFTHKHHHMKWKESKLKSEFSLIVQAGALFQSNEIDWNLNKASGVSFNTLSVNNNTLCLDYNMSNLTVGVTPCYPSYNPSTNRDPSQQWVWGIDALIRPFVNSSLCLTTHYPEGDPHMYLETCDIENVQQHYAWQGQTNMGYGSGPINWGPFSLGILSQ